MSIETPRLIIRQFTLADVDALFGILADEEVMRYSLNGPLSRKETEAFIAKCIEDYYNIGYSQYAVILKETQEVIGYCGFFIQIIDNIKETELGYRLGKAYWGQGLATEAAKACQGYAFSLLGLTRLISIIEPTNAASIRVAEKAGLSKEKTTLFHQKQVFIYSLQKQV